MVHRLDDLNIASASYHSDFCSGSDEAADSDLESEADSDFGFRVRSERGLIEFEFEFGKEVWMDITEVEIDVCVASFAFAMIDEREN